MKATAKTVATFAAFAATVPIANWIIGNVGTVCHEGGPCLIPVGFGLMSPSGVVVIGAALVLRDYLHEIAGWRLSVVAILVGGLLSLIVATPALALASAVTFTLSEMADLTVYAALRRRGRALAVMASQLVGACVDSALFLFIAFGSFDYFAGNTLGKLYAGVAVAAYLATKARRAA
jgi:hypothetical protein